MQLRVLASLSLLAGPMLAADPIVLRAARIRLPPPPSRDAASIRQEPDDLRPFSQLHDALLRELHQDAGIQRRGARCSHRACFGRRTRSVSVSWAHREAQRHQALGTAMLHGAQLAIDEANARGGYGGKPFRLKIHNDGAVGAHRATRSSRWSTTKRSGPCSDPSAAIPRTSRCAFRCAPSCPSSIARPPTRPFPETIIPWILHHAFRTIACNATRWRAASIPSLV